MVPDKNHIRFRQLVTGEISHSFKLFSANMCLSRNQRKVAEEGRSPMAMTEAIEDLHSFFVKFESIMTDDLNTLFAKETPC
jgi:hypothetical protein